LEKLRRKKDTLKEEEPEAGPDGSSELYRWRFIQTRHIAYPLPAGVKGLDRVLEGLGAGLESFGKFWILSKREDIS